MAYQDALRGYAFAVHKRDEFKCVYCGLDGTASFSNWLSLSLDHLLPGGNSRRGEPEFWVTACGFCNVADNRYFETREELVAQRKPHVEATRRNYRDFWEKEVWPTGQTSAPPS